MSQYSTEININVFAFVFTFIYDILPNDGLESYIGKNNAYGYVLEFC